MKGRKSPCLVIGLVLVLTLVAGYFASTIVMDNDVKIYFPHDHESYIRTKALDSTYGSQVLLDICISTEDETILTWENLDLIRELSAEFETLEFVQSVTGLTNTDYPVGTDDGMSVSSLVPEDNPETEAELMALKERLLDWSDMYNRTLYSDNFKSTQILVRIDDKIHAEEMEELYFKVKEITAPFNHSPLSIVIAGDPVITQVGKQYMLTDLSFLIPVVIVVLFICLFFSFRKLSATILPLLTVMIATLWTVGTMALFGVSFTIISSCLPVLIIAVGSAYGIHVINHYYHIKESSKIIGIQETLSHSLKEIILPILLAGFTTLVGFISIMSSPVVPMKSFGAFAALGTLFSLILSLTLIPALLQLSESRHNRKKGEDYHLVEEKKESALLKSIFNLTHMHKKITVLALVVLTVVSFYGLININVESALISYFPYNSQVRQDSRFISDEFAGTNTFNIVFSAEEGKNLTDPAALKAMDDLKQHILETFPEDVGKILSYSDFVKRMNQIMNYPVVETEDSGYEDYEEVASDGFFTDDSFFGEDSGSDSFFTGDSTHDGSFFEDLVVDTDPVPDSSYADIEFLSLGTDMNVADFVALLQNSLAASGRTDITVAEFDKMIREMTNYRGAAYYEIPWDVSKYPVSEREELQNLISQYLLLYSGSLDEYANDSLAPTEARMLVQVRSHETNDIAEIIAEIDNYTATHLPAGFEVHNAGIAELELALTNMITSSQMISLALALIAVFLIIAITYKSPTAGLIGIVPLGFSILVNFGLMSLLHINLDMVTALIASIAIGVGVDYTVHFLSRYKKQRALTDDLEEVTRATIMSAGRGIIINAVSVGLGFGVLSFSRFIVLRYIGLLVAVIMGTSSLGALIILPLLLNSIKPRFMSRPARTNNKIAKKSA
ncbi:MAG: RND family transporter [Spirochaetales bacterium]|nr:RND family transporter [Spirochaetales bacterium]